MAASSRLLVGEKVPLILVSDNERDNRDAAIQGLLAGADDAVQYPFRVEELMARITSHVCPAPLLPILVLVCQLVK